MVTCPPLLSYRREATCGQAHWLRTSPRHSVYPFQAVRESADPEAFRAIMLVGHIGRAVVATLPLGRWKKLACPASNGAYDTAQRGGVSARDRYWPQAR